MSFINFKHIEIDKNVLIVGLDLSLTATGVFKLCNTDIHSSENQSYTLRNDLDGIERIIYIEKEIEKLCKDATLVVIENYAFDKKFRREMLGELQGVIKRRLYLMGKKYITLPSTVGKLVLTGQSEKPKECKKVKDWVMKKTLERYNIDFQKEDNECDAFGLAIYGFIYYLYNNDKDSFYKIDDQLKESLYNKLNNSKSKKIRKTSKYYLQYPHNIIITPVDEGYKAYIENYEEIFIIQKDKNKIIKNLLCAKKEYIKNNKKMKTPIKCGRIVYQIKK